MDIGEQTIEEINGKKYVKDPLSKILINICMEVYNQIGPGCREKIYEQCVEIKLKELVIEYEIERNVPIKFGDKILGYRRPDFVVAKRFVLELKIGDYLSIAEFKQVMEYLKLKKIKLGIIFMFTTHGVKFRRVVDL